MRGAHLQPDSSAQYAGLASNRAGSLTLWLVQPRGADHRLVDGGPIHAGKLSKSLLRIGRMIRVESGNHVDGSGTASYRVAIGWKGNPFGEKETV